MSEEYLDKISERLGFEGDAAIDYSLNNQAMIYSNRNVITAFMAGIEWQKAKSIALIDAEIKHLKESKV